MMTKFKFYLLSILAVISLTTLTSCETDEDIGYGLAGAFGQTWYGDFGSSDAYGEPLYSEIMARFLKAPATIFIVVGCFCVGDFACRSPEFL